MSRPGSEDSASGGPGPESLPTRDQVLDELSLLATLEHAAVVRYLRFHAALGGDLESGAQAGASAPALAAAAQESFSMALNEMSHVRQVNQVLVLAGRAPMLHRATHVVPPSGSAIPLEPFTPGLLEPFPERDRWIASTMDQRYAGLRSALLPPRPVFDGKILDAATFLIGSTGDHATAVDSLAAHLAGLELPDHLRAARVEPADELERVLLGLSDRYYGVLVAALAAAFDHDDRVEGQLRTVAVSTMDRLNDVNRELVKRGVLPAFTITPGG